jgi:hypothetical protein
MDYEIMKMSEQSNTANIKVFKSQIVLVDMPDYFIKDKNSPCNM